MRTTFTAMQWIQKTLVVGLVLLGGVGCVKVNKAEPAKAELGVLQNLSVTFDSVIVGNSRTLTATITNSGTEAATDMKASALPLPFTLDSTTCGALLPVGDSCEVQVSFTPTAAGSFSATAKVSFWNGYKTSEVEVAIAASAITPASLSLSAIPAFGAVVIGNQVFQPVTVTNNGQAPATVMAIAALASPFDIDSNTCAAELAGGASCSFNVSFTPSATAAANQTLSISYQDGVTGQSVSSALSGSGLTPAALSFTGTGAFGDVTIGLDSTHSLTVSNTGDAPATAVALVGPSAPFSVTSNNCGLSIAPGGSCQVDVKFTPTVTPRSLDSVGFTYEDGVSAQSVSLSLSGTGLAPASLGFSPTDNHGFGNIIVGNTSAQTFTMTNSGQTGASLTLTGPSAPFSLTSNACGATLAAGANCQFEVTYAPTVNSASSGSVKFDYGDGVQAQVATLSLSGTGKSPASLSVSPVSPHDFSTLTIGKSATQTFTLSNSGDSEATSLSVGTVSAPFNQSSNSCGSTLAGGASCDFEFTFAPTLSATSSGASVIGYHDGVASKSLSLGLQGAGKTPASLAFDTDPLSLGTIIVGQSSVQSVTLTNSGETDAASLVVTAPSAPFSITDDGCTSPLAAGASCLMEITYTPSAATASSDSLGFTYHDGVSAQSVSVAIDGTAKSPATLTSSPVSPFNFGSVLVGASAAQQFTITNTGDTAAVLTGFSFVGTLFNIVGTDCTFTLAAGASCHIDTSFTPSAGGPVSMDVTIGFNDGIGTTTQTVSLAGTGVVVAALGVFPSSHDFGTLWLGENSEKTFTVSNSGTGPATSLAIGLTTGVFTRQGGTCGTSLAAGASCTFIARFTPTATTQATKNTLVGYESGTGPLTVPYSLTGIAKKRTVFVTSATYNGNLGGITGGDEKCRALASAEGLVGSFRAILSDSDTNALSRFTIPGSLYDSKGTKVATSASNLTAGTLSSSIKFDEDKRTEAIARSGRELNPTATNRRIPATAGPLATTTTKAELANLPIRTAIGGRMIRRIVIVAAASIA